MTIYFVSNNPNKIEEMQKLFEGTGHTIEAFSDPNLIEIQSTNSEELIKDKTLKAFEILQKPLLVEHTYLKIKSINDFPGGLTASFWKSFGGDLSCKHFGNSDATAETIIAYCDMKRIHFFEGSIEGKISNSPKGKSLFQWDTIFIPNGQSLTFAEMGPDEKNKISMRFIAVGKLLTHLQANPHV